MFKYNSFTFVMGWKLLCAVAITLCISETGNTSIWHHRREPAVHAGLV